MAREAISAGRSGLCADEAPAEVVALGAYLEHVAADLQIDLITVSASNVGGTQVALPQRSTPVRHEAVVEQSRASSGRGTAFEGAAEIRSEHRIAPRGEPDRSAPTLGLGGKLEDLGLARIET